MVPLSKKILAYAAEQPEGTPLLASELLHFGKRAAIDQSLARLARRGHLIRARRGIYLAPVTRRFGARPPEPTKVIEAIALRSGETVVPSEAASANALGLTTQVPVREVYLTSGHSQRLQLGKQVLELKHVPAWKLRLANRPAGQALRAIAGAGPKQAHLVARQIQDCLNKKELAVLADISTHYMPAWMAKEIYGLRSYG